MTVSERARQPEGADKTTSASRLTESEWKHIDSSLKASTSRPESCFLKVIFRSNLGIYEKEKMWVQGLEKMGFEIDRVENLWSAASHSGLLVIRLREKCVILALWIIDDATKLVSIKEVEDEAEITGILYSFSSSNIISGVMRVFTYESIPDQNL